MPEPSSPRSKYSAVPKRPEAVEAKPALLTPTAPGYDQSGGIRRAALEAARLAKASSKAPAPWSWNPSAQARAEQDRLLSSPAPTAPAAPWPT